MNKNELMKLNIQLFAETADNNSAMDDSMADSEAADGNDNLVNLVDSETNDEADTGDQTTPEFDDTADSSDKGAKSKEINDPSDDKDITKTQSFSRRLKQETQKIQEASKAKLDGIAKSKGFENWEALEKASEEEQLTQLGIEDKDTFEKFLNEKIENNPVVVEAKKIIEEQKNTEISKILNSEIEEISKLDPTIKSLDDLAKIPEYEDLMDKAVNRGYSLSDAFRVVAFNRITSKVVADSKEAAISNINSKSHMKTSSGSGSDEVYVPADIMATYKKNCPEMSEEAIAKDYNKFLKGGK